jgi:D-amino peptidase
MKIYISADIEGVTGTTDWNECELGHARYKVFQEQMTKEVAAACEAANQAGATEILVKDAHWTATNIIQSGLPENTKLIRGWSHNPYMMMQDIDGSFDAALLIGYHSKAGSEGNPLAHTMTGKISRIWINDEPVSEMLINTYTAALEKVPVVFVSGDKQICNDSITLNPDVETVAVKDGKGGSTINIHPGLAIKEIEKGVQKSLKKNLVNQIVTLPEKFILKIEYQDFKDAYRFAYYPGVEKISEKTIQFETANYFEVLRAFMFLIN